jgi:hypothetical protein
MYFSRKLLSAIIAACLLFLIAETAQAEEKDSPVIAAVPLQVTKVPTTLRKRLELADFYQKYVSANGFPILGSAKVSDYAMLEAGYLVNLMIAKRPDVRQALIDGKSRLIVMAYNEMTTDVPEHSKMKPKKFWDRRARGLGGSPTDPVASCAEENLLCLEGDHYDTENILIHEFAHLMHLCGVIRVDQTFDGRLKQTYENAMQAGLWKGKYAATNKNEYWAEGVQSWFDNNRPPDHDHNHVDTRKELIEYDPGLARLCKEVFGDTVLRYVRPQDRKNKRHLTGFDWSKAPKFEWPDGLEEWYREYNAKKNANKK